MIDPRALQTRREEIAESCRRRGVSVDLDALLALQQRVSELQTRLDRANRRRKEHQAAGRRPLPEAERRAHAEEGRRLKAEVQELEAELSRIRREFEERLRAVPNFLHPEVPEGGEDDYRVIRQVGEPPRFDFEPLDHLEIGRRLDLFDFEGGARVAGQKWVYLKNEAVLLELALQRFALDRLIRDGFTPLLTPDVARPEIVEGIGFNPRGEETQIYTLENANLCLIGTAEITLGGLYADHIFDDADLPLRLAGVSHCFRTEAGAAGRESKGLYRVHQFTKVEMFAFTRPDESDQMHEQLLALEESIFRDLEVPYRVIDVASGDLGAPAYRKFDIEAWMPGRGEAGDWGEVTSTSNCTDYQARRLRIRYRRKDGRGNECVHMLNGTAVAISRTLIPLLENHQCADGSVRIPKALAPYVGVDVIGPR